jgi:hypothetical protein
MAGRGKRKWNNKELSVREKEGEGDVMDYILFVKTM